MRPQHPEDDSCPSHSRIRSTLGHGRLPSGTLLLVSAMLNTRSIPLPVRIPSPRSAQDRTRAHFEKGPPGLGVRPSVLTHLDQEAPRPSVVSKDRIIAFYTMTRDTAGSVRRPGAPLDRLPERGQALTCHDPAQARVLRLRKQRWPRFPAKSTGNRGAALSAGHLDLLLLSIRKCTRTSSRGTVR